MAKGLKTKHKMKKLLVAGLLSAGMFTAGAQNKIGYINTQELISAMPEAAKADSELTEYQASLQKQGEDLAQEADAKAAKFVKDSGTLKASMKEIVRTEIVGLYQRVQNYNQEAQEKANQYAQQKFVPIRNKAMEKIKEVAKENGYAYVLDFASVIVGPPGDDIIGLVKKKLGIKDQPVVPKTAPAKTN
jgi:outer membrane protein